ncbi:MAG TPA: FAD-dependent oxidoreductase [Frankiaceae bacterium]|nr:FAD-dependent oxidoreductase [Frankiaceae bacterium]
MARVIVVGAGIAGVTCAGELIRAGHDVEVRERAMAVGGRMAAPLIEGRRVDIGASYFTASDPDFVGQVQDWCARGLARRWTDRFPQLTDDGLKDLAPGPWRYATPGGLRSLVADLAPGATRLGQLVARIEPGPAVDGDAADAVVLAMPDPQAERILAPGLPEVRSRVERRSWEPVIALAANFNGRLWEPFEGAFINDHPILKWVADDGRRRGDDAAVLVAHSTSPFAAGFLTQPSAAGPEMADALDRLLGCGRPRSVHIHRWSFARPADTRTESHFFGSERVGLAGDGWGSPRVETAWLSGRALGRRIAAGLS